MPNRIQLRRVKGYRKPPNAIVVARPSKWGNPFRVGDAHLIHGWPIGAEEAVTLFRAWLDGNANATWLGAPPTRDQIRRLEGRDLACWCRLCPAHRDGKPFDVHCEDCAPCHADVLGAEANRAEAA